MKPSLESKPLKTLKTPLWVAGVAVIALAAGFWGGMQKSGAGKTVKDVAGFWEKYRQALISVRDKVEMLRKLDEDNQKLLLENANLRLRLEALHFDCRADDAAKRSREVSLKLDRETGSRMGRTLASIGYRVPAGLLPQQLYTLALTYFRAKEDEKAAVLLTFLTGMEQDDTFKTARNYLFTGIAWYRLDNLSAANSYFDLAMKAGKDAARAPASATGHGNAERGAQEQVRLWKAIVYERLGKHAESQEWRREVLNYNPHSMEAAWVNGREANRVTAGER